MVDTIRNSSHFFWNAKFEEYITDDQIIITLCKIRAKYAQQRNKKHLVHLLSKNSNFNYHLNSQKRKSVIDEDIELLKRILPSRRNWKKLKKKHRYKKNNQRINGIDYNIKSLLITINYYKKNSPEEPFLKNLNEFIQDIRTSINDPNYRIQSPTIIPSLKDEKKAKGNVCRPISIFNLKDKLIISLTSKYFTEIFDEYFYEGSFAFRAARMTDRKNTAITHHDAIQYILDKKNQYTENKLWVAECDISKFYDSVHHTVVKNRFRTLINKVKKNKPILYDHRAENIFYKYLESYSFVKNVRPFNTEKYLSHWEENRIPDGSYGWVEEQLIKLKYFKNVKNARIGVPQGGALSGLIANLVLDYADKKVTKVSNRKLCYARFCDDMVIIHSNRRECNLAISTYTDALRKLHLIPHQFAKNLKNTKDSFWDKKTKSKYTYRWSNQYEGAFPWIGFVGYEMHFEGDVRVRKKSLIAEKKKQKEEITKILKAIENGKRKSNGTIFESAANRLIGMSVGRIDLSNFKTIENEMCWVTGFVKLTNNKHVRAQLRDLDRYRGKQLAKLLRILKEDTSDSEEPIKLKIGKHLFVAIRGISDIDSANIRDELMKSGVLNRKFYLNLKSTLLTEDFDLGLSEKYKPVNDKVLELIQNPGENRQYIYYGKPFSYYYHIIERK